MKAWLARAGRWLAAAVTAVLLFGLSLALLLWIEASLIPKGPLVPLLGLASLALAYFAAKAGTQRLLPGVPLSSGAIGAVLLLLAFFAAGWWIMQPSRNVALGMTRVQAITAFGRPPDHEDAGHFPPCEANPPQWYGDCPRLKASGAVSFLSWRRGIDELFVLGLDPAGKVVFRQSSPT